MSDWKTTLCGLGCAAAVAGLFLHKITSADAVMLLGFFGAGIGIFAKDSGRQ